MDPTDSSWLKNEPPNDPPEESRPDDRIERDEFVELDAGDKDRGAYPYSLK